MMQCDGLDDWTRCSACKYLCSPDCPIEGQDVVHNLSRRLKVLDSEGIDTVFISVNAGNKEKIRGTHG